MKTNQKLEELRQNVCKLSYELRQMEEKERDEVSRPILRKLIGKCFLYQNAGGGSVEGRWPLYAKVITFNEKDMSFTTVEFQRWKTSWANRVEIEVKREHNYNGRSHFGVDSNWEPISVKVYNKARAEFLRFVQSAFLK